MSTTTVDLLPRLREAVCDAARQADDRDAVAGIPARWVVSPATTAEVSAVLRVAFEHHLTIVPRGSGSKLAWGTAPERIDIVLDLTRLDTLVEHAAGDLIAVVGAGRRLADLQQDLAGSAQWLAVDPARSGTVGGLVATASTGPTRLLHGPVRDLVIGATMVRADGVVARSGGKVVKNVAGYDLGKLLTGSYGTLGVLTEVAFRLHPVPEASRWVCLPVTSSSHAAGVVQDVIHSHLVPTAVELDWAGGSGTVSVRLDGIPPGVEARSAAAVALLGSGAQAYEQAPSWWGVEPEGEVLLKVSHETASLAVVLDAVAATTSDVGVELRVRGSAAVGSLLVGLGSHTPTSRDRPTGTNSRNGVETADSGSRACPPALVVDVVARLRTAAPSFGGAVVVLEAPPDVRSEVDVWGPVRALELMRRVKEQFDPTRILSPGRFVGGI